jgi:3',5'-cyclic AMP phosphodiesterase CpdA
MSLVLHLSDLHLGSPSDWQLDHTDKFGLDRAAGDTKIDHLRHSLKALGDALRLQDRTLEAVVVSGDLTNANQQDGYDAFPGMLAGLGDRLPDPHRIVVVPGNHDADWRVQPGEARKFNRFLDAVRGTHHAPLIAGLDYDETTLNRATGSRPKATPILELSDAVIVAISSADFCGVREKQTTTDWDAVQSSYLRGDASPRREDSARPAQGGPPEAARPRHGPRRQAPVGGAGGADGDERARRPRR